jgi:hypothetical protein
MLDILNNVGINGHNTLCNAIFIVSIKRILQKTIGGNSKEPY